MKENVEAADSLLKKNVKATEFDQLFVGCPDDRLRSGQPLLGLWRTSLLWRRTVMNNLVERIFWPILKSKEF